MIKNKPKCERCGKKDLVVSNGHPKYHCKKCMKYFNIRKKPTKNKRIILSLLKELLTEASVGELNIKDLTEPPKDISADFAYIKTIDKIGNLEHQEKILEKDYIIDCIFLYRSGDKIKVIRNPQKYWKIEFENYTVQFLGKHSKNAAIFNLALELEQE